VFGVLVLVDLAFVLAHDLNNHGAGFGGYFQDWRFDIARDGGYSELFGYSKQAFIVVAFAFVYWRTRQLVYAAWSFAILVVLGDDALMLHERGGEALASLVDRETIFGTRPAEALEPVVWGALAVVVLPALVLGHRRSNVRARRDSLVFVSLLAALAAFSGVVDLLNRTIDAAWGKETAAGLRTAFEEGGEQAVLSAATAFALWCAWREWSARRPRPVAAAPDGLIFSLPDGRSVEISAESAQRGFAPAPDGAKTVVCDRCGRTRSAGRWHSLRLSGDTREALDHAALLEREMCDSCRRQMAVVPD
jgi:hypothetical protein